MILYRICHAKWATSLEASGYAARWNSSGFYMLYTSQNLSLACLENLVHRKGLGENNIYEVMYINLPEEVSLMTLDENSLPENWNELSEIGHQICRKIGDEWIKSGVSVALKVPSVIISREYNILLNARHPDYGKIKIEKHVPFSFDSRLGM